MNLLRRLRWIRYSVSTNVSFFQQPLTPPPMSDRLRRLYARTVFYPTLVWNYSLARVFRIRHWWDFVDDRVIVGAFPFARDVAAMYADGVRAVVNTCEEYDGPMKEYDVLGIKQFHMPTTDFTHPSLEDVVAAVGFIDDHVDRDETVYIHCKAGRARSATVAMAWLMDRHHMSPAEAQQRLLEKRPHINPRLTQRPVIEQFAEYLKTKPTK